MEKSAAAKHSAAYRERQNAIKAKMGIEVLKVETAAGTRSGMKTAMKDHGYKQMQELFQDLALSFLASPLEEQARRLRKPDASAFVITPELARQFEVESRREMSAKPADDEVS